jgi:hypothetical protein
MKRDILTLLTGFCAVTISCAAPEQPQAPTDQVPEQPMPPQNVAAEDDHIEEIKADAVVAFTDSRVPIINTINMSEDGEFSLIMGAVVGTVEPGTLVSLTGVKLGGFHNDPIAYNVSTADGLHGFVIPEYTGLLLTNLDESADRYVQAKDLIRIGHQGCAVEGPFATVTIWSDGQTVETACSEVSSLFPATTQDVAH